MTRPMRTHPGAIRSTTEPVAPIVPRTFVASGSKRVAEFGASLVLAGLLAACGGADSGERPATGDGSSSPPQLSAAARIGELAFKDPSLSASGRMSCQSCHDPAFGHGPSPFNTITAGPVALGGADLNQPGTRAVPSINYLRFNKAFHFAKDGTPTGGFFWDGRAQSLADQAGQPLLNPAEMANASKPDVVAKLARAGYAEQFRVVFGADVFDDPEVAYARLAYAIAQYQQEDPDFAPFSSKFDAFQNGRAELTAQELRGLALFNAPNKGNCAACHSSLATDGHPPLFTDFSYDNLGLPRNAAIPANADPAHTDLGLCQSSALQGAQRPDLCGSFKVPSLRNVARKRCLFHNCAFTDLAQAVRFYVSRDTQPQAWYPPDAQGQVVAYNDLPAAYRQYVNTAEAPYDRRLGQAPALTEAEIDDLVAFLSTLSDGWQDAAR